MAVAGPEFSTFRPKSEANAGVSGAVAYSSATDMMCDGWVRRQDKRAVIALGKSLPKRPRLSALIDPLCLGVERRNRRSLQAGWRRHPRRERVQRHPGGRIGTQACRYMADTTPRRWRLSRLPCHHCCRPLTSPPQYLPAAVAIRSPVPRHLSRDCLRQSDVVKSFWTVSRSNS